MQTPLTEAPTNEESYRELMRLLQEVTRVVETMRPTTITTRRRPPYDEFHGYEPDPLDDYFGNCPICGSPGIGRDIGHASWLACDTHRLCWDGGSAIGMLPDAFADLDREALEAAYAHNRASLQGYRIIKAGTEAYRPHAAVDIRAFLQRLRDMGDSDSSIAARLGLTLDELARFEAGDDTLVRFETDDEAHARHDAIWAEAMAWRTA